MSQASVERTRLEQSVSTAFDVSEGFGSVSAENQQKFSEEIIRAMTRSPQLAEAMLIPLAQAAVGEMDEKAHGEVIKALGLIRDTGGAEAVEEALRQAGQRFEAVHDPEEIIQEIKAKDPSSREVDRGAVDYLFQNGVLNMKEWNRADFLEEMLALRLRDEGFQRFKKKNPVRAAQEELEHLEKWQAHFEWLSEHDGVVPKSWERTDGIFEDLKATRGYKIPEELVDGAIAHPDPKVAKAAGKHHRLNGKQKARLVLRDDVNLGPDAGKTFRRWDMDLHLMTRRRMLGARRQPA